MTFTDLLLDPLPHLTVFSHDTPEAVFVNSLRAILCSFNPRDVVYTDGSKSDSVLSLPIGSTYSDYLLRLPLTQQSLQLFTEL